MRAEVPGIGPRWFALAIAALLAAAAPASADGLYGTAQFQYQRADVLRSVAQPDGSRVLVKGTADRWLKSVDVHQQTFLRSNLLLDSNLRFSEETQPGTLDRTRVPLGALRLIHPLYQLTVTHQPVTQRSTTRVLGGTTLADTTGAPATTTRNTESMLLGHVAMPNWPQVDASWRRRQRSVPGASRTDESVARNARMTLDRPTYSLYAMGGDQTQRSALGDGSRGRQRQVNLGGAYRWAPASRRTSLTTLYDLSGVRSEGTSRYVTRTFNSTASVLGDWRPAAKWSGTLNYQVRTVDTRASVNSTATDHEGSAMMRWTPLRGAYATGGAGVRSARTPEGRSELLEYATAVAATQSRVRKGWDLNASLSHTTSWDPLRGTYGAQTLGTASRMQFGRRTALDLNLQATATGDTASADQRWSNAWIARLQTQPLRTLQLIFGLRSQRVGPGPLRPLLVTRGYSLDGTWRPVRRLDLIGSFTSTTLPTAPDRSLRTWTATGRLQPTARWQLYGSWSHAAQPVIVRGVENIVLHDSGSGRLQYQPTRRVAVSTSLTVDDRRTADEIRRGDVTLTWSFGR